MPHLKDWECNLGYIQLRGLASLPHNSTGHLVIAIHGFLDNANSMTGLVNAFPQSQFIAIDLPGHGKSDHRPPGVHYNLLDYVQDFYGVINKLDLDKVVLVGHSLGGIIASLLAGLFPERVAGLISIDACGPVTQPAATSCSQIRESIESRASKMLARKPRVVDLDSAASLRAAKTDLSEKWCKHILKRNIILTHDKETHWSSDSRLRTLSLLRLTDEQAENIIRNIVCPVLILAASDSFKALPSSFKHRQHWLQKDSELNVLQGGHHIHLERSSETNALIAKFIKNRLSDYTDNTNR